MYDKHGREGYPRVVVHYINPTNVGRGIDRKK